MCCLGLEFEGELSSCRCHGDILSASPSDWLNGRLLLLGNLNFTPTTGTGRPRNAYSVRVCKWANSIRGFNAKTLWPVLKKTYALVASLIGIFTFVDSYFLHARHTRLLAWSTISLVAVVIVQFWQLHKAPGEGHSESDDAQGWTELQLLNVAREIVRVVFNRNDGRSDFTENAHWTMWANDLEKIVEQSPMMELSFLKPLSDQWRRMEIVDDTLQSADDQLTKLIQERSHYRFTKTALENPVRRSI